MLITGEEVEMEGDPNVRKSNKWLESLSKGVCNQLEALSMEGLRVVEAHKGFVRCSFVVSGRITDSSGNWHVGAMATLIDDVGAAAVYSAAGEIRASFDFSISYYSTAKTQEEVGIEAKVAGDKERITSVVIKIRRKENGELIALGKQWMSSHNNARLASKL